MEGGAPQSTKMPTYTYLAELRNVFADTTMAKEYAKKHIQRRYVSRDAMFVDKRFASSQYPSSTTHAHSVFGTYVRGFYGTFIPFSHYMIGCRNVKCGIEVLGQRPYAKNSTQSKECFITVPQLKAACMRNGIVVKNTMKKVDLLALLMRV